MRILMIQPTYHSGGAEIAGNWPSSWANAVRITYRNGVYQDPAIAVVKREREA